MRHSFSLCLRQNNHRPDFYRFHILRCKQPRIFLLTIFGLFFGVHHGYLGIKVDHLLFQKISIAKSQVTKENEADLKLQTLTCSEAMNLK